MVDFLKEALQIIPIIEYSFQSPELLELHLNHGFDDVGLFFPTWREFLDRSLGKTRNYDNYMAYLLNKRDDDKIIGVLAVQLVNYDILKSKVQALTPDIKLYLYLSWIALETNYQKVNYFAFLFEFYHTLVRRFQIQLGTRIGGAAIAIRRMRPYLWSLLNTSLRCPSNIDKAVYKETTRLTLYIKPSETISPNIEPVQDHVLILFDTLKVL
jgi:hypothetical protein